MFVAVRFSLVNRGTNINIMGISQGRNREFSKFIGSVSLILSGPLKPKSSVKWFRDLGPERKEKIYAALNEWRKLEALGVDTSERSWPIK
jgi:hypothetical protein